MSHVDFFAESVDPIMAGAETAAIAAGQLLLSIDRQVSSEKSAGNLVTEADLRCERLIIEQLREIVPDAEVLSEESAHETRRDAPRLWIIDPLDGTNNFAQGIPQFCVSIAFATDGVVRGGVIYDPNRRELFRSADGRPATMNGIPISVSAREPLNQAIIGTGFYYDRGEMMRRTLQSIDTLFSTGMRGMRRFGSAALDLAWVACGRLDGYFEYQLGTWDFAAGAHLVCAAGGRCSDRDGAEWSLSATGIIAANPRIYPSLLQVVQWPENQ